jgi:hypothetical protein
VAGGCPLHCQGRGLLLRAAGADQNHERGLGLLLAFENFDGSKVICRNELIPPEWLLHNEQMRDSQNVHFDWWAFGLLAYQMITGTMLIPHSLTKAQVALKLEEYSVDHKLALSKTFASLSKDRLKYQGFLERILSPDVQDRPTTVTDIFALLPNAKVPIMIPGCMTRLTPIFSMYYAKVDEDLVRTTVKYMYSFAEKNKWKFAFFGGVDILCRVHRGVLYGARKQRESMKVLGLLCVELALYVLHDISISDDTFNDYFSDSEKEMDLEPIRRRIRKALGGDVNNVIVMDCFASENIAYIARAIDIIFAKNCKHAFPYGNMDAQSIRQHMNI